MDKNDFITSVRKLLDKVSQKEKEEHAVDILTLFIILKEYCKEQNLESAMRERIKKQDEKISILLQNIEKLGNEINSKESKINNSSDELSLLKKKSVGLEDEFQEKSKKIRELTEKIKSRRDENEELAKDIAQKIEKLEELKKNYEELVAKLEKIKRELEVYSKANNKNIKLWEIHFEENKEIFGEIGDYGSFKEQVKALEKEIDKKLSDYDKYIKRIAELYDKKPLEEIAKVDEKGKY